MSNKEGIPQQPLILTVLKDLEKLGHAFFYQKIDARKYLLPQRRNRVFGCSVKTGDKSAEEIQDQGNCWKEVFCRMGAGPTEQSFTLNDLMQKGLEPQPLHSPQDARNWKTVVGKAKLSGQKPEELCMHMGSSSNRLEWAHLSSTCIRPSHDIFCGAENRPLTPIELLRLQGVFASDFECPDAVTQLPDALARDFAGNAFPTTVLQANLICSMVAHPHAWHCMATGVDAPAPPVATRVRKRKDQGSQEGNQPNKSRKKNTQEKPSGGATLCCKIQC